MGERSFVVVVDEDKLDQFRTSIRPCVTNIYELKPQIVTKEELEEIVEWWYAEGDVNVDHFIKCVRSEYPLRTFLQMILQIERDFRRKMVKEEELSEYLVAHGSYIKKVHELLERLKT